MPRKKFKYSVQEMPDISSTTDHTAVADGSINETSGDPTDVATRNESITKAVQPISNTAAATAVAESTDESANSEAATKAPAEIIQEPVNNATSAEPPTNSDLFDKPISNGAAAEATTDTTAMSANEHSNNATAPHSAGEHTPRSEPGINDCMETTTDSPPIEHTNVKRSVLDESGNSLEDVLEALKTQNTDRIPDSAVPGKYAVLINTDLMVFARIITGIGMKCVDSNLKILASALEIEKERLREYERNKLSQIKQDRIQMNIFFAERTEKEKEYQEEEERLPKDTEKAIACLNMRVLADRDLKDILSEPTELIGEFKEEDEFENLIRAVDKENAGSAKKQGQTSMKETYYWPIIKQRANTMGPLPESSGKKTGITPQEKYAAKRLVIALGYGPSRDSILKARSYLKLLSDLREAGVTLLLLYRTKEFRTHFLRHPNELTMLLSWNQLYHPHLYQLRLRVIAQAGGDFSGQCDLEDQDIFNRLHIPQGTIWRDDLSDWKDLTEKDNYLACQSIKAVSGKSNMHILRHGIKGDIDGNKSIYVSLVSYEGISGKKTFAGKAASTDLLAVSPLVSVSPGDFLGIFSGRLRYTDKKLAGAIQGPVKGLWLDRSEVKGKLNRMKVAKAGEQTNVCLVWEGVNEVKGEKTFCQYWRILVIATRHIMPFDHLVRPA